jgi:4-hydroxy-2-oxoheptanedioate aldolase
MQHGVVDYQAMVSMLAAIATSNAVPVVRVPWLDPAAIMKALDAGAYGVIVPMVNTPEDAQRLVDWTTYAPKGGRSYGPIRAMLYGGADYPAHADATIVRFAMIETKQALDNLDAILATPGLDAVYVGPSDLSLSLGCAPKFEDLDPPAAAAVQTIVDKATAAGVIPGIHCGSVAGALGRVRQGFRFVTIGSDNRFMATGAAETVKGMRAGLAKG